LQEITGGKDFQEWVATSEEFGVVKYWKGDCSCFLDEPLQNETSRALEDYT
jgi:hypothetical protein